MGFYVLLITANLDHSLGSYVILLTINQLDLTLRIYIFNRSKSTRSYLWFICTFTYNLLDHIPGLHVLIINMLDQSLGFYVFLLTINLLDHTLGIYLFLITPNPLDHTLGSYVLLITINLLDHTLGFYVLLLIIC